VYRPDLSPKKDETSRHRLTAKLNHHPYSVSSRRSTWLEVGASKIRRRVATAKHPFIGLKLLLRESLEAKTVGGASTLKEERKPRPVASLTARSEPYNRKAIHASGLNHALMRNEIEIAENDVAARNYGSQRRHRGRHGIVTGKANVFGFCSGAPTFVPKRETRSLWLPALVVAVLGVNRF